MGISLIARNETGMFRLLVRFISVLIKTFCFDQWPSVRGLFVYVFSSPRCSTWSSFVRLISLSSRVFAYDDRILLGIRSRKVQKIPARFPRNYSPILIQTRLNKHFRKLTIKPIRIQNLRQPIKENKERKKS